MDDQLYTIRRADNSDRGAWDEYVTVHQESSPYHLFAWKNAVEQAYNHKASYLIVEQNRQIVGILPLIHLHFPYLVNELAALPYCDVGNFLCDNEAVFDKLLAFTIETGEKNKVEAIHIRGRLPKTHHEQKALIADETNKVRMLLELPGSSEALMAGFKSKLRSQIRKAGKNGLVFRWGGAGDLDKIYPVFSTNMRDLGSPVHSKLWFRAVLENFEKNARVGLVDLDGATVGGCIILTIGDKVAIPWASTLRQYNRLAPNMLLYWNVLKYSCDNGFKTFDFGRSSQDEGTYRFKSQWGAKPIKLEWFSVVTSRSRPHKQTKKTSTRRYLEKIWQKFPLPVANSLGPIIRKYVSL